jgi:hypothetical protein
MTSSNKTRRYLQHHKQQTPDSHNTPQPSAQLLVADPTSPITTMRKFRGKTHQQSSTTTVSIPQICLNNNDDDDDDNGHVSILNEFDEVLENELKHTSVSRTLSLKQKESNELIVIPVNQQRSFSFALGSSTNLHGEKHDDDDDDDDAPLNILSSKAIKLPATNKSSLSKETFSRLFHSLTFRSGSHSSSKISITRTVSQQQQQQQPQQHPCIACQSYPNLDLIPKNKKRPSIFGVLVSKLNTSSSITTENISSRCSVCKRPLSKSISNNDGNQKVSLSKTVRDPQQLSLRTKRRRSLPSLFYNLLESSSSIQHRPSFSLALNHNLIDNNNREQQSFSIIKQSSTLTQSSTSLSESEDSSDNNNNNSSKRQRTNYDDLSQLTEKVSK